jgi:hypothetical protein
MAKDRGGAFFASRIEEAKKMKFPQHRLSSIFCLVIVLLLLCLVNSCSKSDPNTSPKADNTKSDVKADPKAEFIRSLKGANVDGFNYAIEEDAAQVVTSMTNNLAKDVIMMDKGDSTVVVRYTGILDRKTNTAKTYKAEAVKKGQDLSIVITDILSGAEVSKDIFPVNDFPAGPCDGPKFDSIQACIKDFYCKKGSELLCEANKTCKDQFAGMICPLNNGQCVSVHVVIRPTDLRCIILGTLPDRLELAFTR